MEGGLNEKFAPQNENKHQSHTAQVQEKTILYNRRKSFSQSPGSVARACNLRRGVNVMGLWDNITKSGAR